MYLPDAHLFTKDNKKKEAITEQDLVAFGMESVFIWKMKIKDFKITRVTLRGRSLYCGGNRP